MDLRRHQVEELRWGLGDERLEQRPVLRVKQILKIKWEIAGAHNHAENSYSISFRKGGIATFCIHTTMRPNVAAHGYLGCGFVS